MTAMSQSQLYIGTQNGVVVCVNSSTSYNLSGSFYHSYSTECFSFSTLEELLFRMEDLFNTLAFPFPATNERRFQPPDSKNDAPPAASGSTPRYTQPMKRERVMKDEELLMQHGDLGSFIIRVQHRQNSSWQGRLTWVEKDQTVNFRSVWEMVKLIDSAISTSCTPDADPKSPGWDMEGGQAPSAP